MMKGRNALSATAPVFVPSTDVLSAKPEPTKKARRRGKRQTRKNRSRKSSSSLSDSFSETSSLVTIATMREAMIKEQQEVAVRVLHAARRARARLQSCEIDQERTLCLPPPFPPLSQSSVPVQSVVIPRTAASSWANLVERSINGDADNEESGSLCDGSNDGKFLPQGSRHRESEDTTRERVVSTEPTVSWEPPRTRVVTQQEKARWQQRWSRLQAERRREEHERIVMHCHDIHRRAPAEVGAAGECLVSSIEPRGIREAVKNLLEGQSYEAVVETGSEWGCLDAYDCQDGAAQGGEMSASLQMCLILNISDFKENVQIPRNV